MKNLKISFIEEENDIKFEEYYFNGLQAPKDISFKEISLFSFKIFWKFEDINILNIDKKQIKFKVEMRKENENEKFVKIYEGNDNNCFVQNINADTNYEIRICSIFNNIVGNWTEIQKVKTKEFSIILKESQKGKEFYKKILEWTGAKNMKLLYRASRDGTKSDDCHNKCDNQGPTICLFQNDKGNIFGGYSSISRGKSGNYKSAPKSFIFTLSNIYNHLYS